jgi:hypothetical protein
MSTPVPESTTTPKPTPESSIDPFDVLEKAIDKGIKAGLHALKDLHLISQCFYLLKNFVNDKVVKEKTDTGSSPQVSIENKVEALSKSD